MGKHRSDQDPRSVQPVHRSAAAAGHGHGAALRRTLGHRRQGQHWHPVRIQQVIGRARRICSHQELPETLRTVDVFLYLIIG